MRGWLDGSRGGKYRSPDRSLGLASILGNGGEVFFPKLGEDQMLTFSSICDKFVTANGLVKDPCSSDDEAKRKAAALGWDDNKYPTVYFGSDTTGEKAYEEFYVPWGED